MDTDFSTREAVFAPASSELLSLFAQAGLGLISIDSRGRVLYANAVAAQLVGRTAQNLIGDSIADITPTTKEREIQLSLMPELASGVDADYRFLFGERIDVHVQESGDGGRLLLIRDRREPRSQDAVHIERRASEIALAEERLAESQRAAEIGSWEWHLGTGQLSGSHELFRLLDSEPANGQPAHTEVLLAKLVPDDVAWLIAATQNAICCGEPFARDLRISLGGVGTRWVHIHGRALRDSHGKALRLVGTLQNVTAQKTIELQKDAFLQTAIEVADHDPLTGLLNHRAFHHYLRAGADRLQDIRKNSPIGDMPSMAIVVMDMDNFTYFNDTYGHLTGDEVLSQVASAIISCCREGDMPARIGGDEFGICLPRITRDEYHSFLARLRATADAICYEPRGGKTASIPLRVSIGAALFPDEAPTFADALYLADKRAILDKGGAHDSDAERLRATLSQEMDGFSMLDALVAAVDNKDRYTRRHSEEVMLYCASIADQLGLDESEKSSLQTAALVHDVGKIGVPNRVLRLPTKLNAAQFDVVKRHPVLGGILVSAVPELNHTLDAVRYHHERWDGRGYPSGLAGDSIPFSARIMAVADAYSAMTNDRPYRKGMPPSNAERILAEGSGIQWDPICVQAFLASRNGLETRSA